MKTYQSIYNQTSPIIMKSALVVRFVQVWLQPNFANYHENLPVQLQPNFAYHHEICFSCALCKVVMWSFLMTSYQEKLMILHVMQKQT